MCGSEESTSKETTAQGESVAKGVKARLRGRLSLKKRRRILSSSESSPNSLAQVEPPKPYSNVCSPHKRRRRGKKYSGIGISHSEAQELLIPEVVTPHGSSSDDYDNDYNHDMKTSTPVQHMNQSYTMSPLYDHDNLARISLVPRSPPPAEIVYEGDTEDLDGR